MPRGRAGADVAFWESNTLDEHVALIKRQVERSLDDPELGDVVERVVTNTTSKLGVFKAWGTVLQLPKEEPCEAKDHDALVLTRIWNFVILNWSYIEDPEGFDLFASIRFNMNAKEHAAELQRLLAEDEASSDGLDESARQLVRGHIARLRAVKTSGAGDCFPAGTLLLRNDGQVVPIEAIRPGDRIWGEKDWTVVEGVLAKGVLPITSIKLNNGSWLRLTEDHKVYVAPTCSCRRTACACDLRWERIRVSDLAAGMRMLQPERIAFGASDGDPELAWLDGVYLADGWSEDYRFAISGLDGHPKEAQKHEVERICTKHGIATRWHRKYLSVNSPEWTERLAALGTKAPLKRARTLALGEGEAAALLRGLLADSGANTHGGGRTFTTTSRILATQLRVLLRMFGRRSGYAYIENHGGLGTNPIHRVIFNDTTKAQPKHLRVKEILRQTDEVPVFDIQTADHKVYLPEHDVTVSNCDDATVVFGALCKRAGFSTVRARVISVDGEAFGHVYPVVGLPRKYPTELVPLDPTVRNAVPGWEYEGGKVVQDFDL